MPGCTNLLSTKRVSIPYVVVLCSLASLLITIRINLPKGGAKKEEGDKGATRGAPREREGAEGRPGGHQEGGREQRGAPIGRGGQRG